MSLYRLYERIFDVRDLVKFSDEKAKVTQITATENTIIFVWGVKPGQEVGIDQMSNGLETYFYSKKVKGTDQVRHLIKVYLVQQVGPADSVALGNSYNNNNLTIII